MMLNSFQRCLLSISLLTLLFTPRAWAEIAAHACDGEAGATVTSVTSGFGPGMDARGTGKSKAEAQKNALDESIIAEICEREQNFKCAATCVKGETGCEPNGVAGSVDSGSATYNPDYAWANHDGHDSDACKEKKNRDGTTTWTCHARTHVPDDASAKCYCTECTAGTCAGGFGGTATDAEIDSCSLQVMPTMTLNTF